MAVGSLVDVVGAREIIGLADCLDDVVHRLEQTLAIIILRREGGQMSDDIGKLLCGEGGGELGRVALVRGRLEGDFHTGMRILYELMFANVASTSRCLQAEFANFA